MAAISLEILKTDISVSSFICFLVAVGFEPLQRPCLRRLPTPTTIARQPAARDVPKLPCHGMTSRCSSLLDSTLNGKMMAK